MKTEFLCECRCGAVARMEDSAGWRHQTQPEKHTCPSCLQRSEELQAILLSTQQQAIKVVREQFLVYAGELPLGAFSRIEDAADFVRLSILGGRLGTYRIDRIAKELP